MKTLLFLLGISFFFIFYFFYTGKLLEKAFFSSIFLEANMYVALSVCFIVYVWKSERPSDNVWKDNLQEWYISNILAQFSLKNLIKVFFEKYIYIIAISLFYLSTFLFLRVLYDSVNIAWLFFVSNIVVIILYALEENFKLFRDFLRVNTSVVSLYYIFFHIFYISWGDISFLPVDIWNILLVWLLLYLFMKSSLRRDYMSEFYSYILCFLLLEILVIFKYIFGEIYGIIALVLALFSFLFLVFTTHIHVKLGLSKSLIRFWGIILSCIYIILSLKYIFVSSVFWPIFLPLLLGSVYLLYVFHKVFENYVSLFFALLWIATFFLVWYNIFLWIENTVYIYSICFTLAGIYLLISFFSREAREYDKYFLHIFSLLVNLVWCISFLFFSNISILSISILCFWESLYLFASYYIFFKK